MSNAFPLGAKVRFTQERLAILTPRDRKGLAGRIGVVQTDASVIKKPTVHFPSEGVLPELRLFRMEPGHLELVELPPEAEVTPPPEAAASQAAPGGTDKLSQSELDDLFE